jgi:hypothetical protein
MGYTTPPPFLYVAPAQAGAQSLGTRMSLTAAQNGSKASALS